MIWVYNQEIFSSLVWSLLGSPKQSHKGVNVDNIIPLWESCSSNMVSESCPKLNRANRLVNSQILNKRKGVEQNDRLGKLKAKPWELMLKVDNIIPLWRVVFILQFGEAQSKVWVYTQSEYNIILGGRVVFILPFEYTEVMNGGEW